MTINVDRRSVRACLEQHFIIPTYQRDYKWDSRQLQELIHDIQGAFLECYKEGHGRQDVGGYNPYFLGTIITTDAPQGARAIVDGQQRITTLLLIMAFFFRKREAAPGANISDVGSMLRREVYGKKEFNIEFDPDRQALFELLLTESAETEPEALDAKVDSIPQLSDGTRTLFKLFNQIQDALDDSIQDQLLPNFADFVAERVHLFDIGVPSEQDGHRVFVTMNDRGLRLGPIDLLKGFLLSNISNPSLNVKANEKWTQCIRELRALGPEEDSSFFKTLLRAQYASTNRGKARGDAAGDLELIGDAYHRWVVENCKQLGLQNSDDFFNWVDGLLPFFVSHYKAIKYSERTFSTDFPHVFYNGAKNLTLQHMAILSAIDVKDTSADVEKKIKLVSWFIDYFATHRVLAGVNNNYDNIRDPIFALCKRIRRRPVGELLAILLSEANALPFNEEALENVSYFNLKRQDLLHILARVAEHLEDAVEQTNRVGFSVYVDRSRGSKNFDVEHVVSRGEDAIAEAADDPENSDSLRSVMSWRNEIGALILLPRGKNRSLSSAPFSKKVPVYASENILAQTLTSGFYQNNPQLASFIEESGLPLESYDQFSEEAWSERTEMYDQVIDRIWSTDGLKAIVAG